MHNAHARKGNSFSLSVRHTRQNAQTLQHVLCVRTVCAVSSWEALNSIPRCGFVHVYSFFYQHIRTRLHVTLFSSSSSSPFSIILSLQADNLFDLHPDTHKQVQQLPLAMTWETHLNQKINLGSKTGFSSINYFFPLFYLFSPYFYPSLFYPISCVYVSHSFSRSLSAFSNLSPFS